MKIIGITGSKGKTSVAYLLYNYLLTIHKTVSIYSSLDYEIAVSSNERLLEIINESKKLDYVIIEVNEEYIDIIDSSLFDLKVLTNVSVITEKKEDYKEYLDKILSFFKEDDNCDNVLCYSPEIEKEQYINFINQLSNKTLFGSFYEIEKYNIDKDLFTSLIYNDNKPIDSIDGIKFYLKYGEDLNDKIYIESNLLFDYSAYNINCLFSILNSLNLYEEKIFLNLVKDINIPGRSEVIRINNRIIIITLSLIPILESINQYKQNNEINEIITLFGSIGIGHDTWEDKYNTKEQEEKMKMARKYACQYASLYSDFIYLTSSDPASTNPLLIANEMEKYLIDNNFYKTIIEIDRRKAIEEAIDNSKDGSVIIISGRGNRKKFIIDNKEFLFSDKEIIDEINIKKGWKLDGSRKSQSN